MVLQIKNLAIGYNNVTLVSDLSYDFSPAAMTTIVGPSGCGKSTLLRTIATLIDPMEGEITLDDQPPRYFSYPQYRRQVLYVDQKPILLDETVDKNLALPFRYHSAVDSYERDVAAALLRQIDLDGDFFDQPAQSLSVGQQQRVCLIRALLVKPRFVLLDEPISALDEDNQYRVIELLQQQVKENGLGVVVVTHQINHADQLSGKSLDLANYMIGKGGGV